MDPLFWSGLLLLVGLLLVVGEVFVPSGGLLGFLAVASVLACVFMAFFSRGLQAGLIFLTITAVAGADHAGPGLPLVAQDADGPAAAARSCRAATSCCPTRRCAQAAMLVGKVGTASTHDAAQRRQLRSTACRSTPSAREWPSRPASGCAWSTCGATGWSCRPVADDEPERRPAEDILSQPIESLGLEPFDDPLA